MRTIIKFVLCLILIASCATVWSNISFAQEEGLYKETTIREPVGKEAKLSICPTTLMKESCLSCHRTPDFKIKEIEEEDPFRKFNTPSWTEWRVENKKTFLVYNVVDKGIGAGSADNIVTFFEYAERHDQKHVVIKILSGGGSVFHAWRMIQTIEYYKSLGMIVEIRAEGFCASAAAILFASGSKGHRVASKQSQLMFHELWTFRMFAVDQPSSSEDQARVLRHIQDTGNMWLAGVSKLSKEEWDDLMKRKDFWMNGREALEEYGIADRYL